MAESFDPYRKWLGIPPQEQPPHHYRLLAIPLFESDPDVISNAADGRMAQIKTFQAGKHSQLSQRILNEIATAKVCLLNAEKKAAYDRWLRGILDACARAARAPTSTPAPVAPSGPASTSAAATEFDFSGVPSNFTPRTSRAQKKRQSWLIPACVAAGIVVLGIAGAAILMSMSGSSAPSGGSGEMAAKADDEGLRTKAAPPAGPKAQEKQAQTAKKEPGTPESPSKIPPPAKKPETAAPAPSPVKSPESPPAPLPKHEAPPKPEPAAEPKPEPAAEPKPEPKPEPKSEPQSGEKPRRDSVKTSIPSDEKQRAVENQIHEIFKRDFAGAKSLEGRQKLAAKLKEQAAKSGDDKDAEFVLLRLSGQTFASAGDLPQAMELVDLMTGRFDLDDAKAKAEVLAAAAEFTRSSDTTPESLHAFIETATKLAEDAVAREDFDSASQLEKAAATAAYKAKDSQISREVASQTRNVNRIKAKYAAMQKAMDALKADSSDSDANLSVGQWYCFFKNDWEKGLPFLAKGSQADLADLAKRDLDHPKDAREQVAVADSWWTLSEKESGSLASALKSRARHWYEPALVSVSGLEKIRIQKRLEEQAAGAEPGPSASKAPGRETAVSALDLPWVGQYSIGLKTFQPRVDTRDIGFENITLPPFALPGVEIKHTVFLHAPGRFEIDLGPMIRSGKTPKRFRASLYLIQVARQLGSDGIVWTVEVGRPNRMTSAVTTPQAQDVNPVDVVLPPGTTRIVIQDSIGANNNNSHDWGVMANPLIVFVGRGAK
jgi:outer membrane biosynthesis protein TonB